jgi:hypothetical protein
MGVNWIALSFSFSGVRRRKLVWGKMERKEDNESKAKKQSYYD